MRLANSPYEDFMKEKSYFKGVPPNLPPKGSRCDGCPYWHWMGSAACSATGSSSSTLPPRCSKSGGSNGNMPKPTERPIRPGAGVRRLPRK